jgi:hypothetical protein
MEVWLDVASRFGVPTAILAIVLLYHARVVKEKDVELARVNELRVTESKAVADKMIERDEKYLSTFAEVDKTLSMLTERIK